jgi:hypothetical protein
MDRFRRWQGAHIGVKGRPDWIFIKLHCHAFFEQDQNEMMGDELRRFMTAVMEFGQTRGGFKVHFATAREVFNMVSAALEGQSGDPARYRDYVMRPIRDAGQTVATPKPSHAVGQR